MIDWKFPEFQDQFVQLGQFSYKYGYNSQNLDPYRTGFVTKEEFCQILKEIEPRLEDTDLDEISVAFGELA